jgi:hypothetical protein
VIGKACRLLMDKATTKKGKETEEIVLKGIERTVDESYRLGIMYSCGLSYCSRCAIGYNYQIVSPP